MPEQAGEFGFAYEHEDGKMIESRWDYDRNCESKLRKWHSKNPYPSWKGYHPAHIQLPKGNLRLPFIVLLLQTVIRKFVWRRRYLGTNHGRESHLLISRIRANFLGKKMQREAIQSLRRLKISISPATFLLVSLHCASCDFMIDVDRHTVMHWEPFLATRLLC